VVADFNRDGKIDIVTVNYENTVSVMLGVSNGAFASPVNYSTGSSPFTGIKEHGRMKPCDPCHPTGSPFCWGLGCREGFGAARTIHKGCGSSGQSGDHIGEP
jgi:hypothetical protein